MKKITNLLLTAVLALIWTSTAFAQNVGQTARTVLEKYPAGVVGYPTANSAGRAALQDVADHPENYDFAQLMGIADNFYDDPDVTLPEEGKKYMFIYKPHFGEKCYAQEFVEAGAVKDIKLVVESAVIDPINDPSLHFTCHKTADGKYYFVTNSGKYFCIHGSYQQKSWMTASTTGFTDEYLPEDNNIVVRKFQLKDLKTNAVSAEPVDFIGSFLLYGKRGFKNSDKTVMMGYQTMVNTGNDYFGSDTPVYSWSNTSVVLLEEVPGGAAPQAEPLQLLTTDPTSDQTFEAFPASINLTFNQDVTLTDKTIAVTLDGNTSTATATAALAEGDATKLIITVTGAETAGTYTITIPAGFVTSAGGESQEIVLNYTLIEVGPKPLGGNITSLAELSTTKCYVLYNPIDKVYAVHSDTYGDKVWTANSDQKFSDVAVNMDTTSPSSSWMAIVKNGKLYLYNMGIKKYLQTPAWKANGNTCEAATFSVEPVALTAEPRTDNYLALTSHPDDDHTYLCAAPQFNDRQLTIWTKDDHGCAWVLQENPNVAADPTIADQFASEPLTMVNADPASGQTLTACPTAITVTFNQAVTVNADQKVRIALDGAPTAATAQAALVEGDATKLLINVTGADATGVYTITLPAGLLSSKGGNNQEITLTYTVEAAAMNSLVYESVSPADNSVVDKLDKIVLTYTTAIGFVNPIFEVQIKNGTNAVGTAHLKQVGQTVEINLDTPITEVGTYTINVPEGRIFDSEYAINYEKSKYNPEFTLTYTIEKRQDSFVYESVSPADNSTVNVLDKIVLTYPSKNAPFVSPFKNKIDVKLNGNNETRATLKAVNNTVEIVLESPAKQEGTYTITVPTKYIFHEDALNNDASIADNAPYNPEFTLTYTVAKPEPLKVVYTNPTSTTAYSYDEFPNNIGVYFNHAITLNANLAPSISLQDGTTAATIVGEVSTTDDKQLKLTVTGADDNGTYLITLPAGYINSDAGTNEEIVLNYILKKKVPANSYHYVTVTPENNSEVTELTEIQIAFPKDDAPGFYDMWSDFEISNGTEKVTTAKMVSGSSPEIIVLKLRTPITAAGTYSVTIPEHSIINSKYDGYEFDQGVSKGALYNPDLTFTYTISAGNTLTLVSTDPASSTEVTYDAFPENIKMTFDKDVNISADKTITVGMRNGVTEATATATVVGTNAKQVDLKVTGATEDGLYMITIPAGYFTYEGGVSEEILLTYIVKKPVPANTYVYQSVNPANNSQVAELNTINLSYSTEDTPGFADNNVTLNVMRGTEVVTTATLSLDDNKWEDVVITLATPITENGTYTITVPEKSIYNGLYDDMAEDKGVSMGATYNPEFTLTYTIAVTGIDGILANVKGNKGVYNLSGVKMNVKNVKQLPKGVYIVNGKKIVIK